FKNIGLGGQLSDGSMDMAFRGRSVQRDITAVELALTTGMRLQEWRTILLPELIQTDGGGASVVLESTTKGQRRRTVYIPQKTMVDVGLYLNGERERVVRNAQKCLSQHVEDLAIANASKSVTGKIPHYYPGRTDREPYFRIPRH